MSDDQPTLASTTDYLYREYIRLGDRCAAYVNSSFDDIKLYGALSVVFAWKPFTDTSIFTNTDRPLVLLLGFVAITFIGITISIFTLIRQSLVVYYLNELEAYEQLLRTRLNFDNAPVFQWTVTYRAWRRTQVVPIAGRIVALSLLISVLFPTVMLLLDAEHRWYAAVYGAIALTFLAAFASAFRIVFPNRKSNGADA